MNDQIGYLCVHDGTLLVVGPCCAPKTAHTGTRIYRINVEPYRQTCCECGTMLVAGRSPAWPELLCRNTIVSAKL